MTVLITGGTGLIGTVLAQQLWEKGVEIKILTRALPKNPNKNYTYFLWNIEEKYIDPSALLNTNCIVHLAGSNIAEKRWTEKRKKEIIDSRTNSTSLLADFLKSTPHAVHTVIASSAIGWYGEDKSYRPFVEQDDPSAYNFLAQTCVQLERALNEINQSDIRLVIVRTGLVLSTQGGILAKLHPLVKLGILPLFGSGKQVLSWIHIADLCNLIATMAEDTQYKGIYNGVAPHPVSMRSFLTTLAQENKIKIPIPIPQLVLKLLLGEMSESLIVSQTVSATKVIDTGFQFYYPTLQTAFNNLFRQPPYPTSTI